MMQIVKHKADPIRAMILSKEGKSTAMKTIITTTRMRITAFNNVWSMAFVLWGSV